MRAILYLRQSQDSTGNGAAVSRQEEDAQSLCERRGWTVVQTFIDNDISAAGKRERPGFEEVLEAIEEGRVDAVVAWSLDRLTRNARDRLRLIEAGKKTGTTVALVRGSDLDMSTPAGRMTADILGSVAQHEIEQKSDRQQRAYLQLAENGLPHPGRRSFGYANDGEILELEAAELRKAVDAVLAGASITGIARDWNARGVTTTAGNQWRNSGVRRTLSNPRHAGLRVHRGETIGKGNWTPIIDEDAHYALRALLDDPSRHKAGRPYEYLLSGLAHCGVCGGRLHGGRDKRRGPVYRCESRSHLWRRAAPVEEYITDVVIARLSRPDAIELFARSDRSDEVARLRSEETALRARLDGLAEAFAAGEIDRRQLTTGSKRLKIRLEDVTKALGETLQTPALSEIVGAEDVRAVWESLDRDRKRAVIDTLVTVIVQPPGRGAQRFDPKTVEIRWKS
jgi:site-specific DNA recombinase